MDTPKKKWIALLDTRQYYIGEGGDIFSGFWLIGGNNKQKLLSMLEALCWGKLDRGYIWKGDYYEDGLPEYVLCKHVDEKKNEITKKIDLVAYDDMYLYEGHTPEDVLKFQEEAEKAHKEHHLKIRNYPEDWDY